MIGEEAIAYFIDNNERIISVAKDENRYNYETQQIEDVFMRRGYEANELAIEALEELQAHRYAWAKLKEDIKDESDFAYADFDEYKYEVLGIDDVDDLPNDDYRYGMERALELIDIYRPKEGEKN